MSTTTTPFTTDITGVIVDFDINGGFDNNGSLNRVYGEDALKQSLLIWFEMKRGEFLRRISSGGYITQNNTKIMNETNTRNLAESIRVGFENDYTPLVDLKNLEIIIDTDKKRWLINMEIESKELRLRLTFNTELKVA